MYKVKETTIISMIVTLVLFTITLCIVVLFMATDYSVQKQNNVINIVIPTECINLLDTRVNFLEEPDCWKCAREFQLVCEDTDKNRSIWLTNTGDLNNTEWHVYNFVPAIVSPEKGNQ